MTLTTLLAVGVASYKKTVSLAPFRVSCSLFLFGAVVQRPLLSDDQMNRKFDQFMVVRLVQFLKAALPITVMVSGRSIDFRVALPSNALSPIFTTG